MQTPVTPAAAAYPLDSEELSVDPGWTVYFDGRPLDMSHPACGYSLDEWRHGGKEFYRRVLTPDSLQRLRAITREICRHRRTAHNVEVGVFDKDRRRIHYFLVNYRPIIGDDGAVVGLHADARNITDIKTARVALGDDNHFLATLINHTHELLWIFYLDGRQGFVNRGFGGFGRREWRNEGLSFFRARLTTDARRRFDRALGYLTSASEVVRNLELEFHAKNPNTVLRLLGTFSPVADSTGAIGGVYATLHDITELTLARAALDKSEARFRALIESAHDLVWTVDRDGHWTYLNDAARGIYGYDLNELIGRNFLDFTQPDHRDADWRVFQQVLRGKSLNGYETVHLRHDGAARQLNFNIQPRLDENWEIVGAMGIARDVTDERLYQRQLQHLADHDELTGLYNRHYFEQELERALAQAVRSQQTSGLLYIDIDNFKYVNDVLGHAAGDELLLQAAQLLLSRLRSGDVLARFGGDEFTVLLWDLPATQLRLVAESFQHVFQGFTFLQGERTFDIRISIGATALDSQTASMGDALAQADLACALAKQRGRNQVHLYDVADRALAHIASDVGWSRKINEALTQNRFLLHFQPIVHVPSREIAHYEVLLRIRDDDNNSLIPPAAFLPAAERFGLIHDIDRRVTRMAITKLVTAPDAVRFTINLSGRVFEDKTFLPSLRKILDDTRIDPTRLIFEVTETAAISNMATAREFIENLRAMNCQVSLDDFGSGFSSYTYLKHLTVDYLKIDGNFVQHMASSTVDQAIVQSMNQVAHALGRKTVAEFVEDEMTLALLSAYGVDYAQGSYLGAPTAVLADRG